MMVVEDGEKDNRNQRERERTRKREMVSERKRGVARKDREKDDFNHQPRTTSVRLVFTEHCKIDEGNLKIINRVVIDPVLLCAFRDQIHFPPELLKLCGYSVVCYQSKTYYLGGRRGSMYSNKVFIKGFDDDWEEQFEPMQSARCDHQSIVVNDKIFVFGCSSGKWWGLSPLTPSTWAEFYSFESKKWTYLPAPPEDVCKFKIVTSIAHYESGNKIVLWISSEHGPEGVYSYDYISENWSKLISLPTDLWILDNRADWYGSVAVIGHLMFWYFGRTIFVYDLIHCCELKRFTVQLHPLFVPYGPSFLFHLGNGKISLLLWDAVKMFYFVQFAIQGYPEVLQTTSTLELVQEHFACIPTSAYAIEYVLSGELSEIL